MNNVKNRIESIIIEPDQKQTIISIPQGCYGYIVKSQTPNNIIGLITEGLATCYGIVMTRKKTNDEIYFLAHIDGQTNIEDKAHGLINWIRICKDKLDINDIKNSDIKIILHYGRDTDKKCKYSDIINKIIKDNILSITTV